MPQAPSRCQAGAWCSSHLLTVLCEHPWASLEFELKKVGRTAVRVWIPGLPFLGSMVSKGQRKERTHGLALRLCWDCRDPFTVGKTEGLEVYYVPRPRVPAVEMGKWLGEALSASAHVPPIPQAKREITWARVLGKRLICLSV